MTKDLSFKLLFEDNTFIFAQTKFFIVIFPVFSLIVAISLESLAILNHLLFFASISKIYHPVALVNIFCSHLSFNNFEISHHLYLYKFIGSHSSSSSIFHVTILPV